MIDVIVLLVLIVILLLNNARDKFKINYYETKLMHRGVDISRVQKIAWYKLWAG